MNHRPTAPPKAPRTGAFALLYLLLTGLPVTAGAELALTLQRIGDDQVLLSGTGQIPEIAGADMPGARDVLRLLRATTAPAGGATATAGFSIGGRALGRARVDGFANHVELLFDGDLAGPDAEPRGAATVTLLDAAWAATGTAGDVVWGVGGDSVRIGSYSITRAAGRPVADAGGPYEALAGEPLTFDGRESNDPDGFIVSYRWTFGDGAGGEGPRPTHSYPVAGTYAVGLEVVDDAGRRSATDFARVTVRGGPTRPDQLLRHGTDGRWFYYRLDGKKLLSAGRKPFRTALGFQPVARADFDGNGYRDLLLRDVVGSRDGRFLMYTLREQEVLAKGDPGLPRDLSWVLVSTDDFDGDGRADALLRRDTGEWLLHLLDGVVSREVTAPLLPQAPELAPAATADFDGDGRADVLLRHADGGWSLYLMDGGRIRDSGSPPLKNSNRFSLEAVADFDGDGDDDVLMRSAQTGGWRLLQMNGTAVENESWVGLKNKARFLLQAATDFDGDGRADVLLRHRDSGRWLGYRLDGPVILAQVDPGLPGNRRWRLVSTADADDDGDADVLLRSARGEWKIWLYGAGFVPETKGRVPMKDDPDWAAISD